MDRVISRRFDEKIALLIGYEKSVISVTYYDPIDKRTRMCYHN